MVLHVTVAKCNQLPDLVFHFCSLKQSVLFAVYCEFFRLQQTAGLQRPQNNQMKN